MYPNDSEKDRLFSAEELGPKVSELGYNVVLRDDIPGGKGKPTYYRQGKYVHCFVHISN